MLMADPGDGMGRREEINTNWIGILLTRFQCKKWNVNSHTGSLLEILAQTLPNPSPPTVMLHFQGKFRVETLGKF